MHLVIHERTRALRCVWCKDSLANEESDVRCACGAQYHAECYDTLSGCATLGCAKMAKRRRRPTPRVRVQQREEPTPEGTGKSAWRWASPAFWLLYLFSQGPWLAAGIASVLAVVLLIVLAVRWAVKSGNG